MASNLTLSVFQNGRRVELPLTSARQLALEANYVWVLPSDQYAWAIEGYADSAYVCMRVPAKPRRFGLYTHTRGLRTLTLTDFECLERGGPISEGAYQAQAARFNRLFGGLPIALRPLIYLRESRPGRGDEAAYKMNPVRTWVVIEGVVPSTGTNDDVDWESFLKKLPG